MADEADHPLAELLAAPVRAIQEAQIAAEREFIEFFLDYGLERVDRKGDEGPEWRLRSFEFAMKREVPLPTSPGETVERTAIVSAPLLSLINLPSIAVEEATISLAVDVSAEIRTAPRAARRASAMSSAKLLPALAREQVELKGRVGSRGLQRASSAKGRLEVAIKLVSSRDEERLGRLSALLGESLSAKVDVSK